MADRGRARVPAVIEQGKLQERAAGKGPPFLLDVRNGYEWDTGRFEARAAAAARPSGSAAC